MNKPKKSETAAVVITICYGHGPTTRPNIGADLRPDVEKISLDEHARRVILAYQDELNDSQLARVLGLGRKVLWEVRKKLQLFRNSVPVEAVVEDHNV